MEVILHWIPEAPAFGDTPEEGWGTHPRIRSQCHEIQNFLGTSLKKSTAEHWVYHIGNYQGAVTGTWGRPWAGYARQDSGSVGLGMRCRWEASSMSPTPPKSDKKLYLFQISQKRHLFLWYLNLWVRHSNPEDFLMPTMYVCTFWPHFEYLKWLNIKSRKVDWIETS